MIDSYEHIDDLQDDIEDIVENSSEKFEHYRFVADVHDAGEMLPWLRTFIGRIESFSCSNKAVAEKFWQDLAEVYAMYGVKKAGEA